MNSELSQQHFFSILNYISLLVFILFIWLNDWFIYNNKSANANDNSENILSLSPPITSLVPELSTANIELGMEQSIINKLKQYRQRENSPKFKNNLKYNIFSRKLANYFVKQNTPANNTVAYFSYEEFPTEENIISFDYIKLKALPTTEDTAKNIVDYWVNREQTNLLLDEFFTQFGVGVINNLSGDVLAVLFLVQPILRYSQPFPSTGQVDLSAKILTPNDHNFKLKQIHYSRGWVHKVATKEQLYELTKKNNSLLLKLPEKTGNWSRILLLMDDIPLLPGHIMRSKKTSENY